MLRLLLPLGFITFLVFGCDTVYRTADVIPGPSGGANVRVVEVTSETVTQANLSPFEPKTLPAVFSTTAGSNGSLRGAGALPEPVLSPEVRPGSLELRVPPSVDPGPYRIGVGDVVLLAAPTNGSSIEELTGVLAAQNSRQGYTVQDDGSINIPNVGRVRLAGLTIQDAEARIFEKLIENQIDPTFSLEVAEFNSRKVAIGGAVGTPTVLPVGITPLRLGDAVTAAGGISAPDQDFASVRLYRDGTLYQIPVSTLFSRPDLMATRLMDGDFVFVDTEYELDRAQAYFEQQITLIGLRQSARSSALSELQSEVSLRRATLAEARANYQLRQTLGEDNRDYVYLLGEVQSQSRFPLPFKRRANLADALLEAGGGPSSATGDISQIYVIRASSNPRDFGAITIWHIDARNAAHFALLTAFEMRPDDVIFIAQQPITKWNRALSQLLPQILRLAQGGGA